MRPLALIVSLLIVCAAHAEEQKADYKVKGQDGSVATVSEAPERAVAITFCQFQVEALLGLGDPEAYKKGSELLLSVYNAAIDVMGEQRFEALGAKLDTMLKESDLFTNFDDGQPAKDRAECETRALQIAKDFK